MAQPTKESTGHAGNTCTTTCEQEFYRPAARPAPTPSDYHNHDQWRAATQGLNPEQYGALKDYFVGALSVLVPAKIWERALGIALNCMPGRGGQS